MILLNRTLQTAFGYLYSISLSTTTYWRGKKKLRRRKRRKSCPRYWKSEFANLLARNACGEQVRDVAKNKVTKSIFITFKILCIDLWSKIKLKLRKILIHKYMVSTILLSNRLTLFLDTFTNIPIQLDYNLLTWSKRGFITPTLE